MPAVFCDNVAVISHRMNSAHPQIDVVIFTSAKRYIEPPGVQKTPAIVHNGPMHPDLVATQKCIVGVRSDIPADRIARHAAVSVNKAKTAVDETCLSVANEAFLESSRTCSPRAGDILRQCGDD